MNTEKIVDAIQEKCSALNILVKLFDVKDILYSQFFLKEYALRVILNFKDACIYIYYKDIKKSNGDIIEILKFHKLANFNINKHVVYFKLDAKNEDEIVDLFLVCISAIEFYTSSKPNTNISIKGNGIDAKKNIVKAPIGLNKCFVRFGVNVKDNSLSIKENNRLKDLIVEFVGNGGVVEIGENVSLKGHIKVGNNCTVKIGSDVTCTNKIYMTCAESTKIIVGNDCMFATNNQIRTDDAHAIYDCKTGKRLNKSQDIIIGDHVWIGYNAMILGGTSIGAGSIVGMGSIVKKKFPNNCIIAGIPAKIIKRDVFWERPNILPFHEDQAREIIDFESLSYCNLTVD